MPVLTVCVVVIDHGRVLLTQRNDFHIWCLPSGGVDDGETVAEAAVRETLEETGLDVELDRLVGIYSRPGSIPSGHAVVFAARLTGGSLQPQPGETVDVRFFNPACMPEDLAFGHARRIQDALQGIQGAVVLQQPLVPEPEILSRAELYSRRDQSGLSPQAFYREWFRPDLIREERQV